jgi:hypothetical protein
MFGSFFDKNSKSSIKKSLPAGRRPKRRNEIGWGRRAEKRSPLKRKPLRNPGESLQEEIHFVQTEKLLPPMVFMFFGVFIAVFEWLRYFRAAPPQPYFVSALAAVAVMYGSFKWVQLRKRIRLLRLGMEGEKAVGQFLEALRNQGCRIFHDIVGNGFNIDHVVIGPKGVFTIETKTYSKPARGEALVMHDGQKLTFNGFEPGRNPISQARAARDWLKNFLHEATGQVFPVRGVVVLPGWYVEQAKGSRSDIWVVNPKALPGFIEHEPVVLKGQDIALASLRLINYVTR